MKHKETKRKSSDDKGLNPYFFYTLLAVVFYIQSIKLNRNQKLFLMCFISSIIGSLIMKIILTFRCN